MRTFKYLSFLFTFSILVTACKSEYKFKLTTSQKVSLGDKATITFKEENGMPIDSVHFFIDGKIIEVSNNSSTINTKDLGVGKHLVNAIAFYPNKAKKVNNFIEVFSKTAPTLYGYKIINTYPHDKGAYTQGLEFYNGFLYETTGRKGKSSLRKVVLKTGEVIQKEDLSDAYFGEGMTIFKDKIFWLTWQANKGFIYDLTTFKQEKEFPYSQSKQGWGLTHNDTELIKSDGSNKIWFLNPETQQEKRYIQAYTNKQSLEKLNELEWVNGKIYANYWQKPLIAIINPDNGVVEGVINLTSLVKEISKTQNIRDQDDVLNGIAYDAKNNRLFVTGKHWSKIFEIELIKQ